MRNYHANPRKITAAAATADLRAWMLELGDISGIVHDLNSDELISGNQRSKVIKINQCAIEIVKQLDQPDHQGTVALGFAIWEGARYSYRQVRWTAEQCRKANVLANKNVGVWDFSGLEENFPKLDLLDWGWTDTQLKQAHFKDPDPAPATAPAPATVSALDIGVVNPKWNKKRTVRFLSIRSWRGASRAKEIERMKVIKRDCNPADVAAVAAELQDAILGMVKNCVGCFVTTAPKGHSRAALHFSDEVAKVLAAGLGVPYVKMFADRELKGSSHPGNWNQRGELTIIASPPQPICIFIDDIATSGATVEQATAALAAWFVMPVVWIYEDAGVEVGNSSSLLG
jgi:hypothetical protein